MFIENLITVSEEQVSTNEKYQKVLAKSLRIMYVVCAFGVLSFVFGLWIGSGESAEKSFLSGVYAGMGAGIFIRMIMSIIRTKKTIRDEETLKKARIEAGDERNRTIKHLSLEYAGIFLMGTVYVAWMVSGFVNMTIFWTLFVIIMVYFVSALGFAVYLKKKL